MTGSLYTIAIDYKLVDQMAMETTLILASDYREMGLQSTHCSLHNSEHRGDYNKQSIFGQGRYSRGILLLVGSILEEHRVRLLEELLEVSQPDCSDGSVHGAVVA